jgi:uncharacterized protein
MTLTEIINADIKSAMLAKEKEKLNALRAIKSALLLEATKDGSGEVNEEAGLKILNKLMKQRMESLEIYTTQGREDLANEEKLQAEVIAKYLPAQMTAEELKIEITNIINQTGAKTMADLGKVMGVASKKLSGKADGRAISELVKQMLQ